MLMTNMDELFDIPDDYAAVPCSRPDENYQKVSFSDLAESKLEFSNRGGWVVVMQQDVDIRA